MVLGNKYYLSGVKTRVKERENEMISHGGNNGEIQVGDKSVLLRVNDAGQIDKRFDV